MILRSQTAEDVAYNFLDIFTLVGAPSILQSHIDKEFANKMVRKKLTDGAMEYEPTYQKQGISL